MNLNNNNRANNINNKYMILFIINNYAYKYFYLKLLILILNIFKISIFEIN